MITARALASELLASATPSIELAPWAVGAIREADAVPETLALEHADAVLSDLVRLIDADIDKAQQRGLQPKYIWADHARTMVAKPSLAADEAVREAVALTEQIRPGIWDAIGALSGGAFERLCDYLLAEYGLKSTDRGLLGQTGDGGVDFFGVLRPYQRPGSDRLYTLGRRFLGQAKRRYRGTVQADEVEAFGSRVALARANNSANFPVSEMFRATPEPIVGLFITGGHLGPSARKAAERHVVYAIEGDQVAEDLARSSDVSAWLSETGTSIDEARFTRYFEGQPERSTT